MATSKEYIEFVCEQLAGTENVRYRKMFGEYMVYVNDKPTLLVCDNTVMVKNCPKSQSLWLTPSAAIRMTAQKNTTFLILKTWSLCTVR